MKRDDNRSAILKEMVITDFKVRYQGSILGYLWSLVRPLFMFVILYVIFTKFLKIGGDIDNYPIYLLLGIIFWNFFLETTSNSITSVVSSGDLIRKIKIPRYLVVISVFVSGLINLGINLLVFMAFVIYSSIDITSTWLLLPILILELSIFAVAVSLILAPLFVKYRDISYIWELLMQAGFYLTPILYPVTVIPEAYQKFLLLNPAAQIIQDARWATVTKETVTSWQFNGYMVGFAALAIIAALAIFSVPFFKKQSVTFAENL